MDSQRDVLARGQDRLVAEEVAGAECGGDAGQDLRELHTRGGRESPAPESSQPAHQVWGEGAVSQRDGEDPDVVSARGDAHGLGRHAARSRGAAVGHENHRTVGDIRIGELLEAGH
jgi:hypothetical protein